MTHQSCKIVYKTPLRIAGYKYNNTQLFWWLKVYIFVITRLGTGTAQNFDG